MKIYEVPGLNMFETYLEGTYFIGNQSLAMILLFVFTIISFLWLRFSLTETSRELRIPESDGSFSGLSRWTGTGRKQRSPLLLSFQLFFLKVEETPFFHNFPGQISTLKIDDSSHEDNL